MFLSLGVFSHCGDTLAEIDSLSYLEKKAIILGNYSRPIICKKWSLFVSRLVFINNECTYFSVYENDLIITCNHNINIALGE